MDIIEEIIDRLKRGRGDFGERPCSRYAPEQAASFARDILKLDPVQKILSAVPTDTIEDLTPADQARLKTIVDRLDRYGQLTQTWPRDDALPLSCVDDLRKRLDFFTRRAMPAYGWEEIDASDLVGDLLEAMRDNIRTYTFEKDLLVWALPCLKKKLQKQLEHILSRRRREVDFAAIKRRVRSETKNILAHLRHTHGLCGLDAFDIETNVLFRLTQTFARADEVYGTNGQEAAQTWVLDTLKGQIKQTALLYCQQPDWIKIGNDAEGEKQKKRRLLQAFSLCSAGQKSRAAGTAPQRNDQAGFSIPPHNKTLRSAEKRLIEQFKQLFDDLGKKIRLQAAIAAKYDSLATGKKYVESIRQDIIEGLIDSGRSEEAMLAEAEKQFLSRLRGDGFALASSGLVRGKAPRKVGGLNSREVVSLWLGMFRDVGVGLTGLWQLYLDLETPAGDLPAVVKQVFAPRGESGENQHYISACLYAMNAGLLTGCLESGALSQRLIALARLSARLTETVLSHTQSLTLTPDDVTLLILFLGCLETNQEKLGLTDEQKSHVSYFLTHLKPESPHSLKQAGVKALVGLLGYLRRPITEESFSKIIAWITESNADVMATSRSQTQEPVLLARSLHRMEKAGQKSVNRVHQNLLRGSHTLMDEFVKSLCDEVENYRGHDYA